MRFFAPYKKFRMTVNGSILYFIKGRLDTDDENVIKAIKKIPEEKGLITDLSGSVVNKSKPRKKERRKDVPSITH